MSTRSFRKSSFFRLSAFTVLVAFSTFLPVTPSYSQVAIMMPPVGQMVHSTQHFEPPQMIGLKVDLKNPFSFGFIMDQGENPMAYAVKKEEFNKIIKYFLVSLAMPNKDMWVNLSPYESKRIIPEVFGQTEMGRDLLAQDYVLKQFTASLMYPEDGLGKKFWNRVYQESQARFGTTDINVNTFNKVWIVADHADVYQKGDTAFLVGSHLKVMLEQDYMAIEQNKEQFGDISAVENTSSDAKTQMASQIVREIIIPAIEKEVNEGQSFAAVRQIYNAEIMATWFKKTLRESLLGQVFANKSKIAGQMVSDPQAKEKIFTQYLQAYKRGVFNYIKKEATPDGQIIPRRYLSGGFQYFHPDVERTINSNDMLSLAQGERQRIEELSRKLKEQPASQVIQEQFAPSANFNNSTVEGVARAVAQMPLPVSDHARQMFMAALVSHMTNPNMTTGRQEDIFRLAQELHVKQSQPSAVQNLWPAVESLIKQELKQESSPEISTMSVIPDAQALATAMANISLPDVSNEEHNQMLAALIHHLSQPDAALLAEVKGFGDRAQVAEANDRLNLATAAILPEGQPAVERAVTSMNLADAIANMQGVSQAAKVQGLVNLITHLSGESNNQNELANELTQAKNPTEMMGVVQSHLSHVPSINETLTPSLAMPLLSAIAAAPAVRMQQAATPHEMGAVVAHAVHQFAAPSSNEDILRLQLNKSLAQEQASAIRNFLSNYFAASPATKSITPMNLAHEIANMKDISQGAKVQSLLNLITHLNGPSTDQVKLANQLREANNTEMMDVVRSYLAAVPASQVPMTSKMATPMFGAIAAVPTISMPQAVPSMDMGRIMARAVNQYAATPVNEQALTEQVDNALEQGQEAAFQNLIRDQFAENGHVQAPITPGGINLSDEHLTMNIKVDGAGMPLPPQYQDPAMFNFNGLVSYIRSITPLTPQNVPAFYELAK